MVALIGCLAVVPGIMATFVAAQNGLGLVRLFQTSYGRALVVYNNNLFARAADPGSRILSDSGMVELSQGGRAAFGDPFLFRIMVDTGRIRPKRMGEWIDSGYYDLVITTSPIEAPTYETYEFGLPMELAGRVRRRYTRVGSAAGLFLYERRPAGEFPSLPP